MHTYQPQKETQIKYLRVALVKASNHTKIHIHLDKNTIHATIYITRMNKNRPLERIPHKKFIIGIKK